MRHGVIGLVCLLFFSLQAASEELDIALAAYDTGQYEQAVTLLTPLAEAGDTDAQLALSNVYNFGLGVAVDQTIAARWLALAAAKDEPQALYNLGVMTMQGKGVAADPDGGLRLLRRAAELDSPDALFVVGVMAIQDAPRTGDLDSGLGALARSGQLGNRNASAMLAFLLQELPEVEHHLVKSALHYQVAIDRGCTDLDKEAARAMARLSPSERASYEYNLGATLATGREDAVTQYSEPGPCFAQP